MFLSLLFRRPCANCLASPAQSFVHTTGVQMLCTPDGGPDLLFNAGRSSCLDAKLQKKESREHFSAPRWSGRRFERRSGPMRKDTCSHVAPGSLVLSHGRSEAHLQRTPFSGNGSTHAAPAARRAQSDTSIREPVFCLGALRSPAFCSAAALCQLRPRCFLPPPSNLSGWMKLLLLHRGVFSHRCSRWFF